MSEEVSVYLDLSSYLPTEDKPSFEPYPAWDGFGSEERAAALDLVHGSLVELAANLEKWVPESFVAQNKSQFNVIIRFDMADVNAEVLKRSLAAKKHLSDLKADLIAMIHDDD